MLTYTLLVTDNSHQRTGTNLRLLLPSMCYLSSFFDSGFDNKSIERAIDLAESFTWEDLPTRDADTEDMTATGWIPRIKATVNTMAVVALVTYCAQYAFHIVKSRDLMYRAWYPFDWNVLPFYELVEISQVTFSLNKELSFFQRCC